VRVIIPRYSSVKSSGSEAIDRKPDVGITIMSPRATVRGGEPEIGSLAATDFIA